MKNKPVLVILSYLLGCVVLGGCAGTLIVTEGESTRFLTTKSPSKLSADKVVYAFMEKQSELTSYQLTTTGEMTVEGGETQQIDFITVKSGGVFYQEAVTSSLTETYHQAYFSGGKVAYRTEEDGEVTVLPQSAYQSRYGVLPEDISVCGYILNEETILSAELSLSINGSNLYRYTLSEEAAVNVKKQIKGYCGLESEPVYSQLTLYLTIDDDWKPLSVAVNAQFTASLSSLGEVSCTQYLTAVYSSVNASVSIPSEDEWKAYLS